MPAIKRPTGESNTQRWGQAGWHPTLRRCLSIMLILAGGGIAADAVAFPFLRCEFMHGDEVRRQDFPPVQDPYGVEPITFRDIFRFKAVVVGDEHGVEYVSLYTYYLGSRRRPTLLHQAKFLAPVVQSLDSTATLTGVNFLYSPEQHGGKPILYSLGNFVFDGFEKAVNNTGWLLRMELDRRGVRRWQAFVARIDKEGLPHPDRTAALHAGNGRPAKSSPAG